MRVRFDSGAIETFKFSGEFRPYNTNRTLFWAPVEIIAPPRPKRKVKKVIEYYANIYPTGGPLFHPTKAVADKNRRAERIACVKLTGEYETYE